MTTTPADWVGPSLDDLRADNNWCESVADLLAYETETGAQSYRLTVFGAPWSKARPKFAKGRTYQPRDDRLAEEALRLRLRNGRAPMFDGNVFLACRFYRPNFQRIDADNMLKHVCDSATGILWQDDSQVTAVVAEVHHDPTWPRTVIYVAPHASSMLRGSDRNVPCENCGEPFLPLNARYRFCSNACTMAARKRVDLTELLPCRVCQTPFRRRTRGQTLCSDECRKQSLRNRPRTWSDCTACGKQLTHNRGGRCRACWKLDVNNDGGAA